MLGSLIHPSGSLNISGGQSNSRKLMTRDLMNLEPNCDTIFLADTEKIEEET